MYQVFLPQPEAACGQAPSLRFHAHGPDAFAEQLHIALADPRWYARWRSIQQNPDAVDKSLAQIDSQSRVLGQMKDFGILLKVHTVLPNKVLHHRMSVLAGTHWELHDVVESKET